jgi:hypothetical protein
LASQSGARPALAHRHRAPPAGKRNANRSVSGIGFVTSTGSVFAAIGLAILLFLDQGMGKIMARVALGSGIAAGPAEG